MTDEQAEALGRRLVACEGFRWMPGMLIRDGDDLRRLFGPDTEVPSTLYMWQIAGSWGLERVEGACWPDLRDPATLGCVLALVRKEHSPACACAPDGWQWYVDNGYGECVHEEPEDTEAEALVAALEAAP